MHQLALKNLGLHIKNQRLAANLTQRELSERASLSYSSLRKIESTGAASMADYVGLWSYFGSGYPVAESASTQLIERKRARKRKPKLERSPNLETNAIAATQFQPLTLSFPYDWSNPNMPADTLIAKVLERAAFDDVSKIFARYGTSRVIQVARDHQIDLQSGVLASLMPAIVGGGQICNI